MTELPIIYDVGMNHGEDSQYYLLKGYRVVGIDANADACRYCSRLFQQQIHSGQMTVLNLGISDTEGELDFFVNLRKDKISTFLPEKFSSFQWAPKLWRKDKVATSRLSTVVKQFGFPHFVKIDVEYFDKKVLSDLKNENIKPKFISSECHDIECFEILLGMGYKKFKLVYGMTVHEEFGRSKIRCVDGSSVDYEFGYQSSGPYGEDLSGPWLTEQEAAAALASSGLGWVDVHACA